MIKEAKFQDDVVEFLRKKKCYVKVMAGNMFMSGMPDIMVINRSNELFFVEHKRWTLKRNPCAAEIHDLLDGPQRVVIPELRSRKVFVPIVAIDCRDENTVYVSSTGTDISRYDWQTYYASLV